MVVASPHPLVPEGHEVPGTVQQPPSPAVGLARVPFGQHPVVPGARGALHPRKDAPHPHAHPAVAERPRG